MHRTPAAAYNFRSTPPTAPTTLPLSLPPWPAGVITARRNTYPLLSFLYLPAHVSIYLSANHFIGRSITAGSCDAAAAANYVIGKVTAACAACNSAATAKTHHCRGNFFQRDVGTRIRWMREIATPSVEYFCYMCLRRFDR